MTVAVVAVEATAAMVKAALGTEGSHDWFHVERVWNTARRLAAAEAAAGREVDTVTVELAALLHDLDDPKLTGQDETAGPVRARAWLDGLADVGAERAARVLGIIATMGFRHALDGHGAGEDDREFACVRDADRLDALGAVGIARCFAYGGARGRALHDPAEAPADYADGVAYRASAGSSLNHFHEKLYRLADGMLTPSGQRLAAERTAYLREFERRFLAEWEGEA